MNVLIINGPNINMLGKRDKNVYGEISYDELIEKIETESKNLGVNVDFFQNNSEGSIVDKIQEIIFEKNYDGLLINPGAYSHYSISIRDALEMLEIPIIEVHISNISKREKFRQKSIISEVCTGHIVGLGLEGYILGLKGLYMKLDNIGGI